MDDMGTLGVTQTPETPRHGTPDRGRLAALGVAVLREPLAHRAHRELLFCLVGVLVGAVGFAFIVLLLVPGTAVSATRGGTILGVLLVAVVASGIARRLSSVFRGLAARLLGERVAPPAPLDVDDAVLRRMRTRLRDGASWRAVAYTLLRLPMAVLDLYPVVFWVGGVIDLTYPLWWRMFRNHPPAVQLSPAWFVTPFGGFRVGTFGGTFVVFAIGAAMVLTAPWVTRAVTSVDRWLGRRLLGPTGLAERVRRLEESRTRMLDDSAAALRRIERDLHDGTQAQLATLAMKLGQAKEKLEHDSEVPFDPSGALELVDAAHRQAKDTLVELRDIARGIHPPALDVGLDAALTTLVSRSAVPATLHIDLPTRPTPAIETIAYFSAAELLANVARHSRARHASVEVTARDRRLRLRVTDDGVGGAVVGVGVGSGLQGLVDRVGNVDGDLSIVSRPGGPTEVTIELPLQT
jgi:signal transduction histidine kinase